MKNVTPEIAAVLLEDHLEAEAVRIVMPDSSEIRLTNWSDPVTIDGLVYSPAAGLTLTDPGSPQDASLEQISIVVPDPDGVLALAYANKEAVGLGVFIWLWVCSQDGLTQGAIQAHVGAVEGVDQVEPGSISLNVGPNIPLYGIVVPPPFSARCQYQRTSQCPFADTCAKTWAACAANGKQSIFFGQTHLVPDGFRLEFQDVSETIVSAG